MLRGRRFGLPAERSALAIRNVARLPAAWSAAALAAGILVAGAGSSAGSAGSVTDSVAVRALAAAVLLLPAAVNLVVGRSRTDASRRCAGRATSVRSVAVDVALLGALAVAGGVWHDTRHLLIAPDDVALVPRNRPVAVEAIVEETRSSSTGRARAVVSVTGLDADRDCEEGRSGSGRLWVSLPDGVDARPARGDAVRFTGDLLAPDGARNPGSFDFRKYLRARSIHTTLRAADTVVLDRGQGPGRAASWVESAIEARLPGETGALLQGLLLGRSSALPDETLNAFRRSGTVHVLAVSGLHVGFIALIAYALLRTVRVPRRAARLAVIPCLACFVALVGPRPSVLRAATMAAAAIVSWALSRRAPPANTLGVAALALLLARPGALFDLGFQLSFGATVGLVLLAQRLESSFSRAASGVVRRVVPRVTGSPRPVRLIAAPLAVSVAAQTGVAPFLVAHTGELSVLAPLANLVVVPLAAFTVASGIAMLAAEAAVPPLAPVFAASAWASGTLLTTVAVAIGSSPWATLGVPAGLWPVALAVAVGLVLTLRPGRGTRRAGCAAAATAGVISLVLSCTGPGRTHPRAVFFDVGQGDAILLEIPWRRYLLVDAGPDGSAWGGRDAGRDVVLPYLGRQGVRRLEALVVTHGHDDHGGGAASVLDELPVGRLVLPDGATGKRVERLLRIARRRGVPVEWASAGDVLLRSGTRSVEVVWPPAGDAGGLSTNNRSLVLVAELGGRLVLTGDIERAAEGALGGSAAAGRAGAGDRGAPGLAADVLKVAHHGSSTSSTPAFLESVAPGVAVVSVGRRNSHGLPDSTTVRTIREMGARLLRTDRDGAVLAAFRGSAISVRTTSTGRNVTVRSQSKSPVDAGPTATIE
jgi:competence protein ComEC